MIHVGQRVRFDALAACKSQADSIVANTVGVVVYINERHKWFSVEYGNPKARTSFKFCDIGSVVKVCG